MTMTMESRSTGKSAFQFKHSWLCELSIKNHHNFALSINQVTDDISAQMLSKVQNVLKEINCHADSVFPCPWTPHWDCLLLPTMASRSVL